MLAEWFRGAVVGTALGIVLLLLGLNWVGSLLGGLAPFVATVAKIATRNVCKASIFVTIGGILLIVFAPQISVQTLTSLNGERFSGVSVGLKEAVANSVSFHRPATTKDDIPLEMMLTNLKTVCDKQILTIEECRQRRTAIIARFGAE